MSLCFTLGIVIISKWWHPNMLHISMFILWLSKYTQQKHWKVMSSLYLKDIQYGCNKKNRTKIQSCCLYAIIITKKSERFAKESCFLCYVWLFFQTATEVDGSLFSHRSIITQLTCLAGDYTHTHRMSCKTKYKNSAKNLTEVKN